MRQQSTKCQWRIEKPLKFKGRLGYGRKKIIRISYKKVPVLFHGRSLHGVGFDRIEDHGVTLLTVASRRGDLVSIKYISSFLRISEIYITHKKQESGELFYMKS
jgi:hypothetical protein